MATESESNALYKLKGDFAIVSGSLSFKNGLGSTTVAYPDGFSNSNCLILQINGSSDNTTWSAGSTLITVGYFSRGSGWNISLSSNIVVNFGNNSDRGTGEGVAYFRIILMKV